MGGQNSGRHRSSKDAPQPNEGESRYAFWVRTMDPQAFAHHLLITAWSARRVGGKHVPRRVLGDPEEFSMTDAQIKAEVLADTAARNRWCDQDITIVKRATEEAVQAQPAMK